MSLVLDAIRTALRAELAAAQESARATIASATDPDSKAENKYDTRSLEASYLARGQSARVTELQEAVAAFSELADSGDAGRVAMGSTVSVAGPGGPADYFIGPAAGGTEVVVSGRVVLVVTPGSPLGRRLIGRAVGESFSLQAGGPAFTVTAVA